MNSDKSYTPVPDDLVVGYEIKRAVMFENDRGFAYAENPKAVQPFVTWQITEHESGERDYYWGHYFTDGDAAMKDYEARVTEYQMDYKVATILRPLEKSEMFKYYSTQRPVDIGTFPKTDGGPMEIESYDRRIFVEGGAFVAWGHLLYATPLTEKQMDDYELRAAPDNHNKQKARESIDQQLSRAKLEVDKENAARPTPPKEKDKDSR